MEYLMTLKSYLELGRSNQVVACLFSPLLTDRRRMLCEKPQHTTVNRVEANGGPGVRGSGGPGVRGSGGTALVRLALSLSLCQRSVKHNDALFTCCVCLHSGYTKTRDLQKPSRNNDIGSICYIMIGNNEVVITQFYGMQSHNNILMNTVDDFI